MVGIKKKDFQVKIKIVVLLSCILLNCCWFLSPLESAQSATVNFSVVVWDMTPPAAISNLTALAGSSDVSGIEGAIKLKWTAPGNDGMSGTAIEYVIKCSSVANITNDSQFSAAKPLSAFSSSPIPLPATANQEQTFLVTGLLPGVTYYFAIKARDNAVQGPNWSTWSQETDVNVNNFIASYDSAPPVATNLTATPGNQQVTLNWSAATPFPANDFSFYRVYYDSGSVADWTENFIATETINTNFVHIGLENGTTYWYRIKTVDTGPNVLESIDFSNIASTIPTANIPNSPTGFTGLAMSSTTILFWWTDNSDNEDGFKIYTSTGGLLAVIGANSSGGYTTWYEYGLTANTSSYAWGVRAFNKDAETSSSTLTTVIYSLANLPTSKYLTNITTNSVQANWSKNGNSYITEYKVEASTDGVNYGGAIYSGWLKDTTYYELSSLSVNTTYYFRVKARNGNNIETSYQYLGSTKTLELPLPEIIDTTPPERPTGIRVILSTDKTYVTVRWNASISTDVVKYLIFISSVSNHGPWVVLSTVPAGITFSSGTFSTADVSSQDEYSFKHLISGPLAGLVLYYKIVSVDASNNFSIDSAVGDIEGTVSQTETDPVTQDKIAEVIIPGNLSSILYSDANSYNDNLEIGITKKVEFEKFNDSIKVVEINLKKISNKESVGKITFPSGDVEIRIYFKIKNSVVENSNIPIGSIYSRLGIYYYNEIEWILLGGKITMISDTEGYISIKTGHLSLFKIGVATRASEFKLTKLEPTKIFTPDSNDERWNTIKFYVDYPSGQTVDFNGKIFDITGRLVRDGLKKFNPNTIGWDGKDSSGSIVPQGVYIYQIEGGGKRFSGTIVVAR